MTIIERLRAKHENRSNVYCYPEAMEAYEKDREEAAELIEDMLATLKETDDMLHGLHERLSSLAVGFHAENQTELSAAMADSASWCLARIGSLPFVVTEIITKATRVTSDQR